MTKSIFSLAIALLLLSSCQKDRSNSENANNGKVSSALSPSLPETPFNYAQQNLPNYLLAGPVANADNTPANNPITNAGASLGRVLFYDKQMSANATVSCASCHQIENGFSDPATLSFGFANGETGRHSMSLANSRYYANGHFFWDERANSLEDQVLMPIQDGVEMGMTLDSLIQRLETLDYYPELFSAAFGSTEINSDRISKALAQFVRSIISFNSKYDLGLQQVNNRNLDFPNFSAEENLGKNLFFSPAIGCAACHGTDAFIAPGPRNNGLDLSNDDDQGIGGQNGNPNQIGQFKVGSLKNIDLTSPYMHDGRFSSLEEVIEHYSTGVQNNPNLSGPLRLPNGGVRLLNLSETEKSALVAFLKTLSDPVLNAEEKFSDPFPES
ncbi:cytochrome-c peroxidase [Croceimicrobium sp.]|uniref:cytochrome-c peroxidase n=1 Tax=Croceimicrobium sp. TaxID=2828340 RepID=UPI003BAA641B